MLTPPDPKPRGMALARFSITRPVTVGMIFAAMLVLGGIAYLRIPTQLLPTGYDLPFLYVVVPVLPGDPEDIEEQITLPVEEMLSTARNIQRLRTRVRSDQSNFLIQFEDGTHMPEAYNQVRDRLERVWPQLPAEVERYFIWKYNPNDQPIFWIGVHLAEGVGGAVRERNEALQKNLIRPLERVEGISRVEVDGQTEQSVRVVLDEDRASAAGLSTYEIIEKLRSDNFVLSAGHLEPAGRRVAVRVMARYSSLDALRRLPLTPRHRLEDVATVEQVFDPPESIHRVDSSDAVLIAIYKEATANTVDVSEAIRGVLAQRFADPTLADFRYKEFRNQGHLIQGAINDLEQTAIYGGVFALLILLFFIREVRMTLMITVAMPMSMLVTLVVMYFTGFTLNMLTLMGLMLSVGMVVDNAIVVVENIQRYRDEGYAPRQAALKGAAEVTLALIVATSTTVIVFLPMILMSGSESLSFYLGKIGFPVCISLIASLFVSLIFVPLGSVLFMGASKKPRRDSASILWLERRYHSALTWISAHRVDAAALFILIISSIIIPSQGVRRTDQLAGHLNDIEVRFTMDRTMTLEDRDEYFKSLEVKIAEVKETLGISAYRTQVRRSSSSRFQVFLLEGKESEGSPPREEIIQRIDALIPSHPGVSHRVRMPKARRGSAGEASLTLQLRGPSSQRLAELSEEVTRRLRLLPGVSDVNAELDEGAADELHYLVDRDAAQRVGLSAVMIGGAIDYALRGRRLPDFHFPGRQVTMRAEGDPRNKVDPEQLGEVRVPSASGLSTPLHLVTRAEAAKGYGSIHREDRQTVLDIQVEVDDDSEDLAALSERIDRSLEDFKMPRGYTLDKGQRIKGLQSDSDTQTFALAMAVIFVFLLMGVLFESASMPFAIVFSIPFAFLGVYWALYITDTALDVMAGVGLVILVGVVVNNAIVLVDTINQMRIEGAPLRQAVIEGSTRRLRPVLMTALTTIFGLIPMASGDAGIVGIPYAPLGRTVIGGLLASTALTLFVVPFLYLLINQAKASRRSPEPS